MGWSEMQSDELVQRLAHSVAFRRPAGLAQGPGGGFRRGDVGGVAVTAKGRARRGKASGAKCSPAAKWSCRWPRPCRLLIV